MGKKLQILFSVTVLACVLSCSSTQDRTAYTGPKQVVAVPSFADLSKTSVSRKVLDSLTDKFATELVKKGRFAVVERTRLNEILKEHELAMTGVLAENDAIKLGRLAQAPYIILCTINHLSIANNSVVDDTILGFSKTTIKVSLTLRVISTTTGTSVAAAEVNHEGTKSNIRMGLDSSTQLKLGDDAATSDNPVYEEMVTAASKLAEDLYSQKF